MKTDKLKIIYDGDSWVFGCEIVDPKISKNYEKHIHPGEYDYLENNDKYRIPKIFPTHLSKLLDAETINLSWPADDNNTILNRTLVHISNNYISKGISTDNLLVIVGWSSPERNSFWYKDDKLSRRFRLWPNVRNFDTKEQEKIWELYVSTLWNPEEYLPRYVMSVLQLQNFCDKHNIKWLCFNSFYQTPGRNINNWEDINVEKELKDLNLYHLDYYDYQKKSRSFHLFEYSSLWEQIDHKRFYKKNEPNNTFKSFVDNSSIEKKYNGWHPSPESHKLWAQELKNYILENKILYE